MNDTIVDQDLSALTAFAPGAAPFLDGLLLPDNPADGLLSPEDWRGVALQLHLSAREQSVAILIFEGKSRFQIARQLDCARGTIRVYIDRLFAKLNVADRLGMAMRVMRVHYAIVAQDMSHKDATCMTR